MYAKVADVKSDSNDGKGLFEYIAEYVSGVHSKEAFLFLRFFLKELNAAAFTTLHRKLESGFSNMYEIRNYR